MDMSGERAEQVPQRQLLHSLQSGMVRGERATDGGADRVGRALRDGPRRDADLEARWRPAQLDT